MILEEDDFRGIEEDDDEEEEEFLADSERLNNAGGDKDKGKGPSFTYSRLFLFLGGFC